jgi:hypothetical protein
MTGASASATFHCDTGALLFAPLRHIDRHANMSSRRNPSRLRLRA